MHCSDCGYVSPKWFGKCPECGSWASAAERSDSAPALEPVPLSRATGALDRFRTGLREADRVLGGGLVRGEALLLAGAPGVGKSTLVLQLLEGLLHQGRRCLLVTGEESLDQVALRARRLNLPLEEVHAVASDSVPAILELATKQRPDVLVVDSIQAVRLPDRDQPGGSITQVRECAAELVRHAKTTGGVVVLVGQVTKDGTIAGPKTLEHMVDAVVDLSSDAGGPLRLLRASKNRFGSCDEIGVFLMGPRGLDEVQDPSAMLLSDRRPGIAGSTIFPSVEGARPLLVEIQALTTPSPLPQPRRVAIGLESRRLSLLLGVLAERTTAKVFTSLDVFVAAVGGFTIREPAADLAVCLALYSAINSIPIDASTIAIGEVGLSGEVRRVPAMARRLEEAARRGFTTALVAPGVIDAPKGMNVVAIADVSELFVHVDREPSAAACAGIVA